MPHTTIATPTGQLWADRLTGAFTIRVGECQPNGRFPVRYGSQVTGELNAETLELLYEELAA